MLGVLPSTMGAGDMAAPSAPPLASALASSAPTPSAGSRLNSAATDQLTEQDAVQVLEQHDVSEDAAAEYLQNTNADESKAGDNGSW